MFKIPDSDEFHKKIEKYVSIYSISDCIYTRCVDEFSRLKLTELKKIGCIRLIRPFLLGWGQMQRWLGDASVEKIFQKLKESTFAVRIEPLRQENLQEVALEL